MKISSFNNQYLPKTNFGRRYKNTDEELKQFELNRNKSIDYILKGSDKDFYNRVLELRKNGITKDFPKDIIDGMDDVCFGFNNEIVEYDSFNYPKICRGIGESELKALKEGKQIYSKLRRSMFGVDTANYPGGVGFGTYLIDFKLKPNLDHYISDFYRFKFEDENMPHIGGWGPGGNAFSHHTILEGTYTLNDVDKITDLETKEVIYDSKKDEILPDLNKLLSQLKSENPQIVIKALENLQTYSGDGKYFLPQAEGLLNSEHQEVVDTYINAIYNYGSKEDMPRILDYFRNNDNLSADVITRVANCMEKFKCIEIKDVDMLVDKALRIEDKDDKEYAFENILDVIRDINFGKGKPNHKEYYYYKGQCDLLSKYLENDDEVLQKIFKDEIDSNKGSYDWYKDLYEKDIAKETNEI